jgi:hypothetical protein
MAPVNLRLRKYSLISLGISGAVALSIFAFSIGKPVSHTVSTEQRLTGRAMQEVNVAIYAALWSYHKTGQLPADARELRDAVLAMHLPEHQTSEWIDADASRLVDP